ncbi:MAG: DUF1292 domain-containing protein [Clostridia bacterium]|nr:DUF1292 domain-containing protein [Clostridia bacterium]
MTNEFSPDIITLIDEDGKEHVFEILDTIEDEKGVFYALFPKTYTGTGVDSNYYIFELIEDEGEQLLAEVQDDELLNELAEIFESHFEDLYEINENNN